MYNTIGYFPKFYPDELLSSAVARYRVHTMASSEAQVNRELYGDSGSYTAVALPRGLRSLHERIGGLIGISVEELAYRTTLYPYYAAFANKDVADRMLEMMLRQREGRKGSYNAGWAPPVSRIKMCPHCVSEDMERLGESYWRRTHQLSCVHFCELHATPLLEATTADIDGKSIYHLTPQVPTRPYLPYLSEKSKQRLMEMAWLAKMYLDGLLSYDKSRSRNSPPKGFREIYAHGSGLKIKNMRRDLIDYFGEQCLEILGINLYADNKIDWLNVLFDRGWAPVKHIAVELFHRNYILPRSTRVRSAGHMNEIISSRAWRCRNPAAAHYRQPVVTNVYTSRGFCDNGFIIFRCSCGYTFSAQSRTWNCRSEPVIEKVFEFGDLFVEMVNKLFRDGMTKKDIGKRLDLNQETVRKILRPGYNQPRPCTVVSDEAKFANRLFKTRRIAKRSDNINIQAQDKELARKVADAVTQILNERPPRQVSAKHLLEMIGIDAAQLFKEPYYPQTLSVIHQGLETAKSFNRRRAGLR